jgi:hypothetical protein
VKLTSADLSRELRESGGEFLDRRRAASVLTIVGMASLAIVTLYQLGVFRRLPEPAVPGLDAERVNGSAEAYGLLKTPDAALGLGSYAATLGLIAMGARNRALTQPRVPLMLAAKCGLDAAQAARLTAKSWLQFRAFSLYSLVTALSTFLVLPLILPEAKSGLEQTSTRSLAEPPHAYV